MRGLPCIRGTRVTVSAILGQLAAGASVDELLASYPYLERDDILAALRYACRNGLKPQLLAPLTMHECRHTSPRC